MKKYFFAFIFLTFFTVSAFSQESRIDIGKVPAVVINAFKADYPKSVIRSAVIDMREGKAFYEIKGRDPNKVKRNVLYSSDGKFTELEEFISTDSVPVAIKKAVAGQNPENKIIKVILLVKKSKTFYEIHVRNSKTYFEANYTADGSIFAETED
jgi:hypothetical protein